MESDEIRRAFRERTWHHTDFSPTDLVRRKDAQGLLVSVVIPARNEARTVGPVVRTIVRDVAERVGLVDEILVVDAHSDDDTAGVAARAGARVVQQEDVLPDAGSGLGKGEALWKGLYAAKGDLIAYVDADILDMDARFVVGLLGPLLVDDDVLFTKAAYDRPLATGSSVQPTGGGRVTELLARPLLTAFWPELAWLAQPLSGEYAGRRALLEQLPFVRGYGVELALLIDIVDGFGARAIGQVDLDRRAHTHQPLDALGRMAAEILAVAAQRLRREGRLDAEVSRLLAQPMRDAGGTLDLRFHEVATGERPPLREYLAGRGG